MAKKKNFFKKLAESVQQLRSDSYDEYEEETPQEEVSIDIQSSDDESYEEYEEEVGELAIDMYRIENALILQTMIAGVQKNDIDITLTRDSLTIEGARRREDLGEVYEEYFQELYWGPFERSIALPEEVDIEEAEAHEHHGLLTIILPLVDKHKRTHLKIK